MKRSLIANSAWNLVTGMSAAVVAVAVPPVMSRTMSPESFGAWALGLQVGAYVNILGFGLQVAVGRFIGLADASNDRQLRDRILSTAFWALAMFAVVGVLAIAVGSTQLDRFLPDLSQALRTELAFALPVLALAFGVLLPALAFAGVFNGLYRSDVPAKILSAGRLLTAGSLIAAMLLGETRLHMLALVYLAASVATSVVLFLAWRRIVPEPRLSPRWIDLDSVRKLAGFCASLTIWNLAMLMVGGFDLLIVGRFDLDRLPIFAAGVILANFIAGSLNALAMPVIPLAAGLQHKDPEALHALLLRTSRWVLAASILVTVPLIAFRDLLVVLWLGPQYAGASLLLAGLLVAAFLRNLVLGYIMVTLGTGRQHRIVWTPLLEGAICLGGSLLLAPAHGAFGVILAKMVGAVIGVLVVVAQHPLQDELPALTRAEVLLAGAMKPLLAILPAIALASFALLAGIAVPPLLLALLVSVVTLLAVWRITLDHQDRNDAIAMLSARLFRG